MSRMCKILWYRLPVVLCLRIPVLVILYSAVLLGEIAVLLGEYAEKSYEWCCYHLPALND